MWLVVCQLVAVRGVNKIRKSARPGLKLGAALRDVLTQAAGPVTVSLSSPLLPAVTEQDLSTTFVLLASPFHASIGQIGQPAAGDEPVQDFCASVLMSEILLFY